MRLTEWPRMPYLNDEVRDWIAIELQNLGVEDLAVYALEAGTEGDERRVVVATEIGLLDHRYAPFGSNARYRLAMLLYPWQVLRGVELRADTFRLWAREHRTRWSFRLHHPHFEAATESPDLGQALCDLARVCAVMAEPFGVPSSGARHEAPAPRPGPNATLEIGGRAAAAAPPSDNGSEAPSEEPAAPADSAEPEAEGAEPEQGPEPGEDVIGEIDGPDEGEPAAEGAEPADARRD